MRHLFFLLLLFFLNPSDSNAQEGAPYYDPINYTCEYIGKIDSVAIDEIYSRGRKAITKMFVNAKETIQLDDEENHELFARGHYITPWKTFGGNYEMQTNFDLDFMVKEGRYRILITIKHFNWYVDGHGRQEQPVSVFCTKRKGKNAQKCCADVEQGALRIISEISKGIHLPTKQNSDW